MYMYIYIYSVHVYIYMYNIHVYIYNIIYIVDVMYTVYICSMFDQRRSKYVHFQSNLYHFLAVCLNI